MKIAILKHIAILLVLSCILLVCATCKKEEGEKEIVTYRFTNEDQPKLLPHYIIGKFLNFTDGDSVKKIEVIETGQKIIQLLHVGGMYGKDRYLFYYEEKRIILKDYINEKHYTLVIKRYPIDGPGAEANIHKIFSSRLILELTGDSYYTQYGFRPTWFNFDDPTTKLSLNGLTFEKIHIMDRSYHAGLGIRQDDWESRKGILNGAKYIYYDENYGIVGFDSFDSQQWR